MLAATMLMIPACSSGLIYNRLDTVARWYVGNLVTLDDRQQAALTDWLGRALAWHRDSELKRYEVFLRRTASRIAVGPDAAIFPEAVQQAEVFRQELSERLAPEASQLLLTLQPAQLDELLTNLEKHDREELGEEQERTGAERQKRRIARLTRALERWTGAATSEQKAIIERTIKAMLAAHLLGEDDEWFASRQAWRAELRQALPQGAAGKPRLEALLSEPEKTFTPAHRQAQAEERRAFLALVTELDATLTARQRMTLERKLNELASDLEKLSRA